MMEAAARAAAKVRGGCGGPLEPAPVDYWTAKAVIESLGMRITPNIRSAIYDPLPEMRVGSADCDVNALWDDTMTRWQHIIAQVLADG